KQNVSAACMAYAALKWVHGILPLPQNPLAADICRNMIEVEKTSRTSPVVQKEPASVELIKDIVRKYRRKDAIRKDLRLATMRVLSFAGLFRAKELLKIRVRDIMWFDDHFVINVPESKTDIYRQGQQVFIARFNAETCPGVLINRYLAKANILLNDSEVHLFRNLVYLKSVDSYTLGERVLSYIRFRENFKECLKELGYDEKLYGLHSFRAGGATTIAKSLTAPNKERLLKLHGRWKTDISKDISTLKKIK
ncbi:Integrase recombinase xerD-like, partial [Paramuricea clavata]